MDAHTSNRVTQQMAELQEIACEVVALLGEHVDADLIVVMPMDGTRYELVLRPRSDGAECGEYILEVG
jgi:hypothetical protein